MADQPAMLEPNNAAWVADQRRWALGWRRVIFPGVFLAWLIEVATAIPTYSHGIVLVIGYVLLGAFSVCYLFTIPTSWEQPARRNHALIAALVVLFAAEVPIARSDTFIMGIFVCVIVIIRYEERGLLLVGALTLVAVFLPPAIPAWHDTIATGLDNGTALSIPLTGFAMLGFSRVINGNRALTEARAEIARLAAENERTRIARDLHDLLGHSLTTITVKAQLAERLGHHDTAAALVEIAEVEALSRRALADVRAAVSNYRDVSLTNELATGRELLRAAGIVAELPPASDIVDETTQELFGWVVREGLTNVVRHSRATSCTVRISRSSVEILDDGVGGDVACGNGLIGLAERVSSAGGVIEAGPATPSGWRLAVRLVGAGAA